MADPKPPSKLRAYLEQAIAYVVGVFERHPRAAAIGVLVLVVLLALCYCSPAHAQVITPVACPPTSASDAACVKWTLPTQNTDGSAIPATGEGALTLTQISRSVCKADGTAGTEVQLLELPPTATAMYIAALPPARHCFRLRVKNATTFSAWTGTASKTTTAPAPPKPRQPTITVT